MRKVLGIWGLILAAVLGGAMSVPAGTPEGPLQVTPDNFKSLVLKSKGPLLLDVGATWCVPCRLMAPIVEKMSGVYSGKLRVAQMDADKNPEAVEQLNVQAFPTLILMRDGKAVKTIVGALRETDLRREIDRFLKSKPAKPS